MRGIVEGITFHIDRIAHQRVIRQRHGLHLLERGLVDADAGRIDGLRLRGREIDYLIAGVGVTDDTLPQVCGGNGPIRAARAGIAPSLIVDEVEQLVLLDGPAGRSAEDVDQQSRSRDPAWLLKNELEAISVPRRYS